ncbi:MAG: hypothetical protein ACXVYY_01085 [Oryzihumus sp.]
MTTPTVRAVFARLTELALQADFTTAVLGLPDTTLLDFSGYLSSDPLESAVQQAMVEREAALAVDKHDYSQGVFGAALQASYEAGVAPFTGDEGNFVVLQFDLADDDLLTTLFMQPLKVEHGQAWTKDIVSQTLPLDALPPDTPGALLLSELARLRGYI